jgi:hypothetical protein
MSFLPLKSRRIRNNLLSILSRGFSRPDVTSSGRWESHIPRILESIQNGACSEAAVRCVSAFIREYSHQLPRLIEIGLLEAIVGGMRGPMMEKIELIKLTNSLLSLGDSILDFFLEKNLLRELIEHTVSVMRCCRDDPLLGLLLRLFDKMWYWAVPRNMHALLFECFNECEGVQGLEALQEELTNPELLEMTEILLNHFSS